MGADELVGVFGEHQVADLTIGLDRLQRLQFKCVPKPNRSILGTSTCGEQAVFVRRPCDGFDGGLMLAEASERLGCALSAPYQ